MIVVREHVHIGPHVVHNHREPLKQGIDGLTGEMSEVLVLSPVGRIHPCLNLGIPNMSLLQHRPNSTSQVLNPLAWCGAARTFCVGDVETPFLGGEAP
jgi:hypothetical protein